MKEELTIKQLESLNDTLEKHSAELEEWQGRWNKLSEKLVAQDKEISVIRNELAQKSNLLNIKLANIDILMHQLAEKDKIINQMKARYEVELNNTDKAKKESKARASCGSGSKVVGFIRKKFLSEKQYTSK